MAKKVSKDNQLLESNNSIIAELRNDRWIYNPVVYSQISGDFTLLQQRILVGIVERLQQQIANSIDAQHRTHGEFPPIFDNEVLQGDGNIEINIPTADLGILAANYGQLQQAAEALFAIQTKIPVFDSKGNLKSFKLLHMFPAIEMPVYQRSVDGETVSGKRQGVLRVVVFKEALRDAFNMKHGYIRHLSQIAIMAKKKRTPRLYLYLSRYKQMGQKTVPYSDLLEYLGLTDDSYFQTNAGATVNPFSEWNRVKSQVLVPVQKELKEMADRGQIDIWFDFEPVYPKGKRRGTPQAVKFSIFKSALGEQRNEYDARKSKIYKWIDTYIAWCPDLSRYDLQKLTDDLTDEQLAAFLNYAYKDVRTIIERKQPDDVAPYVLSCLRRWKQNLHQRDLFSEIEQQEAADRQRKAQQEAEANALRPGEGREQWATLLQRCAPEYRAHLLRATYQGMQRGFPYITFATQADCDAFSAFEQSNRDLERAFAALRKEVFHDAGRILIRGVQP